jgi:hypothetical protein
MGAFPASNLLGDIEQFYQSPVWGLSGDTITCAITATPTT